LGCVWSVVMEPFTRSGRFFLPTSKEHSVHGEFTFDGDTSNACLDDAIVPFKTAVGQALPYGGENAAAHPVIHGELDTGELVTMLQAHGSHRMLLGRFESWRCAVALVGGHAEADAFSRVSMQFDCLAAWAQPPAIVDTQGAASDTTMLDTARHALDSATVDDAVVKLIAHVTGTWAGMLSMCSAIAVSPLQCHRAVSRASQWAGSAHCMS